MCGGNKGQSTTTQATNQNQTSTYTPNAQAAGYINNALQQGQNAAATPFSAPQAPVAGFSQDQLAAFQKFRDLQGAGQQNYQQAANYFSPQGTQDFYNPYAASVTANLKDIFGAQQAQTTGQLTQAAGGVGADRIAVGQADLAKQQDLAAGQTYSALWGNAAQQAQAAGQGQMVLGQNTFQNAYQGANALMGVGGLQQQLNQAQLNSPYQQQLAALAYPFQTAQFNAGITGALAPGLGGTTNSYGYGNTNGTSTPAPPSIWSQLLGAGVAGAGIYGGLGGSPSYGGDGTFGSGNGVYGGSSSNPLSGLSASDYGNGYASGGEVEEPPMDAGISTRPINIAGHSFVPDTQLTPIKANIPQANLNLNPPQQQQQGSSSGGIGDIASAAVKFLPMLLANRGGAVRNPYGYAEGGDVFGDDNRMAGFDLLRQGMGTRAPDSIPGGEPPPGEQPYRLAGPEAMDRWRNGVTSDQGAGLTAAGSEAPISIAGRPAQMRSLVAAPALPPEITGAPAADDGTALGYAPDARPRAGAGAGATAPGGQDVSPYSAGPATNLEATSGRDPGFIGSPWAALTAAGLGMMAGTSPYAGVNIGAGGQQALKTLQTQRETSQKDETIDQAARRLALEAKHHEDQYSRETIGQKNSREQAERPYNQLTKAEEETANSKNFGWREKDDGTIEAIKGGPHDPETIKAATEAKLSGGLTDAAVEVMARQGAAGDQSWAKNVGRGAQGGRDLGRVRNRMAEILTQEQGKSPDQAAQFISSAQKEWGAAQIGANAAARARGTRVANLDMILEVADAAVPAALELSRKVNRTGWVPLNSFIQKGQVMTSDPDLNDFGIANLQLAEGWARAMNPTGVMRESDRDKALSYLSTATSQETYERAVRQVQKQITREKDAISKGHSPADNTKADPGDMPSPKAIELLASDPKKYRDDFEKRYGKGSADRFGG